MLIRIFNYNLPTNMDFQNMKNNIFINFVIQLFHMIKFYVFWMFLHYVTTHVYSYMCTPMSVLGFFTSPLLAISPVCRSIDWMRTISIYTIENMWYLFGLWFSAKMTGMFQGISQRIVP